MDPYMLIIFGGLFVMLFIMMNRNRKRQREAVEMRTSLSAGDEVMTTSGMYGTVVAVEGNVVTIESTPGSTSKWLVQAIGKKVDPDTEYAVPETQTPAEPAGDNRTDAGTTTADGFLSEDQMRRPYRDDKKD